MSAEENLSTVKDIYEAFGKGDVPTILEVLTDDVDWAAEASSDAAPWYGPKKGKEEVTTFFEQIGGALDVTDFSPEAFTTSENEVMVRLHFKFTVKATGKGGDMAIYHYWRFRDGKVEYYRGTEDTAQTAAALAG